MNTMERDDERIVGLIETKPFRLYSASDFLPPAKERLNMQPDILCEIERRLNRLNRSKIIYKMAVREKTYYFSPRAEIES